jgi:hypothetical protein
LVNLQPMARCPKPKRVGTYGLYPRNHPKSIKWRIDGDYYDKLSPEERQWMANFLDCHYAADFRGDDGEWPTEERRKTYIAKNAANVDLLTDTETQVVPLDTFDPEAERQDLNPTPAYLNEPAYKEAREQYRAHLTQGRKPVMPQETEELDAARRHLERTTHGED